MLDVASSADGESSRCTIPPGFDLTKIRVIEDPAEVPLEFQQELRSLAVQPGQCVIGPIVLCLPTLSGKTSSIVAATVSRCGRLDIDHLELALATGPRFIHRVRARARPGRSLRARTVDRLLVRAAPRSNSSSARDPIPCSANAQKVRNSKGSGSIVGCSTILGRRIPGSPGGGPFTSHSRSYRWPVDSRHQ